MGIIYEEKSRQFHLYNDKISYIMTCLPNGQMGQLYYGKRLRHRESFGHLLEFAHRDMAPCVYENDTTFSLEHIRQEYPAFGTGDMRYPAYGIRRENGSRVSCFVYKSHTIQGGKPELPGLPAVYVEQDGEAQTLELYLEDPVAGMELVLLYTIYENMPVLTRSARFICRGPEPVCLERAILLKIRTDQRIGARIIDMVFNNHQCSWLIGAIYAPGSIGKKNLFNAQTLHNTDWKGDQSLTVSLIIVDSSLHGDHLFPHTGSQYKLARMARHSGYRKIRNIMIGNLYRVFDLIRIISQTASQNHTDLRLKICPFADDPDRILNDLYLFFSCHG